MRLRQDQKNVLLDKAAGLESHQFSREEHRFDSISNRTIDFDHLPRQPRIGLNTRNKSDTVFTFSSKEKEYHERDRFIYIPVDQSEKQRQEKARQKFDKRVILKREWLSQIENQRWNRLDQSFEKEQMLLESKREKTKLGKSSVSYNPITCTYDPSERGKELARLDAEAKHRLAIRAARLYAKNNSFHPILCVDAPKDLVENVGTKVAGVKSSQVKRGESVVHPTSSKLSHIITLTAKDVENVSGALPKLAELSAISAQPLSWSRHY